jgi:hypothetical protein
VGETNLPNLKDLLPLEYIHGQPWAYVMNGQPSEYVQQTGNVWIPLIAVEYDDLKELAGLDGDRKLAEILAPQYVAEMVRRINVHDELLDALRLAEKCMATMMRQVTPRSEFRSTEEYEAFIKASPQLVLVREAIQKARVQG